MDIYEAAYENAPDPILIVDAGGIILRANREAEKAFQYPRHELEGRLIEILIPDRFAARHPGHRHRYMQSARTQHMGTARNLTAKRRDGSEFPIDIMLSTAETVSGPVAVAIVQDMTESRKNQTAMREALERVRLSSEAAGMGYWTYDEETGCYWCDNVCARHFGGRPEDFPDRASVDSRILAEDREDRWRRSRAGLEAHGVYESEFRVLRPDGSTRWLRDLGRWVDRSPPGEGRRLAGVTYDISARKQAEIDAQYAQRRERELHEMAPDGIFLADLDGRFTDVNEAGCRMFGMTREEVLKKAVSDLISPEEAGRLAEVKQALIDGGIDVSEWRSRRKNGTLLSVEVSAKIFPDGRWQGFVRDITERKRSEALQADLVEDLRNALREVKVLKGLLPICSHCKKIRDDNGKWQQMEVFIHQRTDADFSHGICPQCAQRYYGEFLPAGEPL